MHIRKKKWARPELEACPFFTGEARANRDKWRSLFPVGRPLEVELGCGKCVSTAVMAHENRNKNFIAMDINADVLGVGRRNVVSLYGNEPVDNLILCRANIDIISQYFSPSDGVERLYIFFCNPWHTSGHQKRRLTHPRLLMQYRTFLKSDGEIWFKTDDDELFRDSLTYFEVSGFDCVYKTYDLHASGFMPNYVTEHENKFTAEGIPIKFGIFRKALPEPDFDPVQWEKARKALRAKDASITENPEGAQIP